MAKDLDSIKKRIAEHVSLGDMLLRDDVTHTIEVDNQVHCPFHGRDLKKSARYYANTDTMYCWVCKKTWDIYNYLMDKEGVQFKDVLNFLIKQYDIKTDDLPEMMEAARRKIFESKKSSYDIKKVCLDKIGHMLLNKKKIIPVEQYRRLVFVYISLKSNTPDERFEEIFLKLKNSLDKI